jgi:multidrug efflux pump subunit AcrA (membrane-fusion protein)
MRAGDVVPDPAAAAALRTEQQAHAQSARDEAQRQVLELGELLERSSVPRSGASQEQFSRALDAYEAAGKVLDRAQDLADLAGVLVLVRMGRDAITAAETAGSSHVHASVPLCFFNPLHGVSARNVRWRPLGQRDSLQVRACNRCADLVRQRRQPDALMCWLHAREVPYYELDPQQSVWAATGYGQFSNDLIDRVLAGLSAP